MTAHPFSRCLMAPILASLLASSVAAPIALAHDDPVEHEINALLDAFLAGASTNDFETHDRFWAEDLVYTSSSGGRFGKSEIMDNLAGPPAEDESQPVYSSENVNIRVLGDIAVVTFRLVATDPAGDTDTEFFNTGVFERRDGQWKAFTWQATRIPEADGE